MTDRRATMATRRTNRAGRARRRLWTVLGVVAVLTVLVYVPGIQPGASASGPLAGSQGTDTSLPASDSAVTVYGQGQYSGLKVTVNQTKNLTNQAVSVTWSGGSPTFSNPTTDAFSSTFNGNYLQIFECWGDPQSSDPADASDPGPLPSQCEFGGESSNPTSAYPIQDVGFEYSRVLTQPGWSTYGQIPGGWTDTSTGYSVEPFDAVDGTVINQQANYNYLLDPFNPLQFWQNPDYSFQTTNEIDFARTFPDGTGQQQFQVDTGLEAPGLGCGQKIEPTTGGTTTPQCWLVVVPRGTPAQENPTGLTGVNSVVSSPLTPQAWQDRIAIPLQFNAVGSNCAAGATTQGIEGGELAAEAFSSWEPALCGQSSTTAYNYVENNDDQARQNLTQPTYGSVGMSVFSNPIGPSQAAGLGSVVYAPMTLSGVVVAFNIQRSPALQSDGQLQADEVPLSGSNVAHLYLTPRLVAKLLTQSYQAQFDSVTSTKPAGYGWVQTNPTTLITDPDFLQYNPEFADLTTQQKIDASTLVVEESNSDAATELWQWVLADPEAKAWLAGQSDPWNMVVNPIYNTTASANSSGVAFGLPNPENFPKSDPYCFQDPSATVYGPPEAPARPLCILDWSPYALTLQSAAQDAALANDGAKTTLDPTQTPNTAWAANGPQKTGTHFVISVTDSASAARYGLQTASLSRAGDDASSPTFVAPDAGGILAGEQAMSQSAVAGVLQDNPSTTAAGAYPLPMLTYAATVPTTLDTTSRQNYANLIKYAAGAGQVSGDQPGQLPTGYVPLPAALATQSVAAAATILNPPSTAAPSATATPNSTSPTAGGSSGDSSHGPSYAGSDSSGDADAEAGSTSSTDSSGGTRSRERGLGASVLSSIRTHQIPIGALRWALPIILFIGIAAAAGAVTVDRAKRRSLVSGATATGPPEGPQPP
jgi:hypothetical protein